MKRANKTATKIGVCSDTHYWFGGLNFEGESLQLQGHSELLFKTLLTELEMAELDMVIHLGDMVSGGGTFQMPTDVFRNTLGRASIGFQSLPMDVYALPGNHDCLVGDAWSDFSQLWSLGRGEGTTIDTEHARLVLLNAQGHSCEQLAQAVPADPVDGYISDQEFVRLENALATAGDLPVLLFTHQLLVPWSTERNWQPFYGVSNSDPILSLFEEYGNVRAVFQGHAHRFDIQSMTITLGTNSAFGQPDNDCTFVVLPSLIEYPLGWLSLSITGCELEMSLRRLPLQTLAEASRTSGTGQTWRAGKEEWRTVTIALS